MPLRIKFPLLLAALTLTTPIAAQTPEETAAAALAAAPVWDGHNDVPLQIRGRYRNMLAEFDFNDTSKAPPAIGAPDQGPMQTDLPRLRKGHLGAQFWSIYVDTTMQGPQAVQAAVEQIDITKRLVAKYPNDMALALTAADVERAMREGRIASLMGLEGGHMIGDSLAVLRQFQALGIRYMTLTHSKNTSWADSADDAPAHGGLSDFGRDVVREMQRLGILVDLSHVNAETMRDALEVARAPVIFSHSNAYAVAQESRNVPDDVLARLKDNGGIIMVVAYPGFVSQALIEWYADRNGEEARLKHLWQGAPDEVKARLAEWVAAHPAPAVTAAMLADHIDHIRAVAGIDHIGIGGDYDGIPSGPPGMEDVSGYPRLFEELARRGYSQGDLEKIASRNMMRVLKAAEAYAAAHAGDPPIETPVPD
jgi:membrane dipeptidase